MRSKFKAGSWCTDEILGPVMVPIDFGCCLVWVGFSAGFSVAENSPMVLFAMTLEQASERWLNSTYRLGSWHSFLFHGKCSFRLRFFFQPGSSDQACLGSPYCMTLPSAHERGGWAGFVCWELPGFLLQRLGGRCKTFRGEHSLLTSDHASWSMIVSLLPLFCQPKSTIWSALCSAGLVGYTTDSHFPKPCCVTEDAQSSLLMKIPDGYAEQHRRTISDHVNNSLWGFDSESG